MYEAGKKILSVGLELPESSIPEDASFETMDEWDSLAHMRIVMAVEAEIGRPVTTDEILQMLSLSDVDAVVCGGNLGGAGH